MKKHLSRKSSWHFIEIPKKSLLWPWINGSIVYKLIPFLGTRNLIGEALRFILHTFIAFLTIQGEYGKMRCTSDVNAKFFHYYQFSFKIFAEVSIFTTMILKRGLGAIIQYHVILMALINKWPHNRTEGISCNFTY